MVRTLSAIFGVVLLAFGILGFMPEYTPNGYLLGIFHVNTVHNLIHITSGIIALLCAWQGFVASRYFFRIFGVIYAIVAVLGFFYKDEHIFGIIANNIADAWLHTAIAVVSLIIGFCRCGCNASCYKKDKKDM